MQLNWCIVPVTFGADEPMLVWSDSPMKVPAIILLSGGLIASATFRIVTGSLDSIAAILLTFACLPLLLLRSKPRPRHRIRTDGLYWTPNDGDSSGPHGLFYRFYDDSRWYCQQMHSTAPKRESGDAWPREVAKSMVETETWKGRRVFYDTDRKCLRLRETVMNSSIRKFDVVVGEDRMTLINSGNGWTVELSFIEVELPPDPPS